MGKFLEMGKLVFESQKRNKAKKIEDGIVKGEEANYEKVIDAISKDTVNSMFEKEDTNKNSEEKKE